MLFSSIFMAVMVFTSNDNLSQRYVVTTYEQCRKEAEVLNRQIAPRIRVSCVTKLKPAEAATEGGV